MLLLDPNYCVSYTGIKRLTDGSLYYFCCLIGEHDTKVNGKINVAVVVAIINTCLDCFSRNIILSISLCWQRSFRLT
jgi:hypothetical protein